jgi:hypothetical protein
MTVNYLYVEYYSRKPDNLTVLTIFRFIVNLGGNISCQSVDAK